jgi:hypothetical protein
LLITGAAITLTVLFRSVRAGHFSNLQSGAYVIFDDDEPVGTPQDQLFRSSDASSQNASGVDHVSADGPDADEQDRDTDPV